MSMLVVWKLGKEHSHVHTFTLFHPLISYFQLQNKYIYSRSIDLSIYDLHTCSCNLS